MDSAPGPTSIGLGQPRANRCHCARRRPSFVVHPAAALLALVLVACGGPSVNTDAYARKIIEEIPTAHRESLSRNHIFFGHQSVGVNILSGIQALSRQGEFTLDVVEARSADACPDHPALVHAAIGKNLDPISKIRDFAAVMRGGLGAQTDIAFLKFCYVDFESGSRLAEVFSEYKSTMATLEAEFPRTTFVHVTSPLTVVQSGAKALLKSVLGKKPSGITANMARHQFNQLLRQEYQGKAPLFDLAALESTYPDGSRAVFEEGGRSYPKLIDAYSSDGGHLNENGARWIAAHLVAFLATLSQE